MRIMGSNIGSEGSKEHSMALVGEAREGVLKEVSKNKISTGGPLLKMV